LTAEEQDRGQVTSNGHKTWTDDFLATGPALHIIEGFSTAKNSIIRRAAERITAGNRRQCTQLRLETMALVK